MVQIIPAAPRRPSTAEKFSNAIGAGLEIGSKMYGEHQKKKQYSQALENIERSYGNPDMNEQQRLIQAYRELGQFPEVAKNLGSQLTNLGQKNISNSANAAQDEQRYDVIKKNFGERAAELYRAAPEGGKTGFLDRLLESRQRGLDVEDLLGQQQDQFGQQQQSSIGNDRDHKSGMANKGTEPPPIKAIDYDRGLLPKERVKRQEERYSKNLPLYQESQKKLQGLDSEKDALNVLSELSPQIGTFQRLNINPESGELIIPALASPEAQRFVKTVNDFTVKAKDSYGSRVSNFELDRFMKRLPTLANSQEGRRQIIRQMQIVNDISGAREKALQDVFDEYGGIRNIDYDKAESMADKLVKPIIEDLKKEYKSIDNSLDREYQQKIKEKKKALVPPGRVAIEKDGKHFSIPAKNLKMALKKGYKQI